MDPRALFYLLDRGHATKKSSRSQQRPRPSPRPSTGLPFADDQETTRRDLAKRESIRFGSPLELRVAAEAQRERNEITPAKQFP